MPATITEHKKCICVEFGDTNNNKVWQYTLYGDGTALTEWGRVGNNLQSKMTTESKALKKWGEKTNPNNKPDKRYTEVKAVDTGGSVSVSAKAVKNSELKDVAKKQIKSKDPIVQKLIEYCLVVNAHQILKQTGGKIIYDATSCQFKTPLGVIAPDQVSEARDLLVEISDFVSDNDFGNKNFSKTLNAYLRLIPHDVGMTKITPELIFPNIQTVFSENDLLDGLDASFVDVTIVKKTAKKTVKKKTVAPKVFNVSMEIVKDSKIISHVKHLYQSTRKSMHSSNNLSVQTVYAITINTMKDRFDKKGKSMKNVWQLWHGTKASNLLSIMKGGLIIPSSSAAHCTGRMYGDGVYFSDISTKALNYATNYWGGGGSIDRTFMFLADVAMGKFCIASGTWGGYPKSGYDSTWAKGIDKGGTHSGVMNDEMIVYNLNQCNLVYLVEFVPRSQYRR